MQSGGGSGKKEAAADTAETGQFLGRRNWALKVVVRPAVAFAALHGGASPELAAVAADAAAAAVESATASGESEGTPEAAPGVIESVTDFQNEFGRLLAELQQEPETPEQKPLQAVVVFIDDLDRCMPDTIIYVFEAIRLFLQVSSTAFVLAANRDIVQAAIDRRYPAAKDGDAALGNDYLEKIVQVEVVVPPLSEPESESYLNMLFAQLRLSKEDLADCGCGRRPAGRGTVRRRHESRDRDGHPRRDGHQ